ncbi:hypothetical protein ACET3Z_027883 [Daucus carota]
MKKGKELLFEEQKECRGTVILGSRIKKIKKETEWDKSTDSKKGIGRLLSLQLHQMKLQNNYNYINSFAGLSFPTKRSKKDNKELMKKYELGFCDPSSVKATISNQFLALRKGACSLAHFKKEDELPFERIKVSGSRR